MTPAEALNVLDNDFCYSPTQVAQAVDVLRAEVARLADVDKLVAQRVVDALMMRNRAADSVRTSEVKTEFLAARVAWHLAHGCDTAQRARELALAEWDAGVLGVVK